MSTFYGQLYLPGNSLLSNLALLLMGYVPLCYTFFQ